MLDIQRFAVDGIASARCVIWIQTDILGVFVSINSDGELWRVMIKGSGGPFCGDFDGDVRTV
jgi:hypothetical protein